MRKSYIALSLILSQALCAGTTATDLIANFGDKGSGGTGNPESVQKPNGQPSKMEDAKFNTDWYGNESYLNIMSNDLTFTFKAPSSENNLVIKNGFNFSNRLTQSDPSKPTVASMTITKSNGKSGSGSSSLTTFTFGSATSTSMSDKISLGSNINLKLKSFTNVKVKSNLSIGVNSTLDVSDSSITDFTNDGGIILEGNKSTLKVKDNLKNNGVIMMKEGSKIESVQNLSVGTTPPNSKNGSIIVQGNAEVDSGDKDLTITNQDIKLQSLVSKKDGKVQVSPSSLTLKSTKSDGTLTLGDTSKTVNITGEIGNKDPNNIPNSSIPANSEVGKVIVDGFKTLEFKNVNFKNINLTSKTTNAMTLNAGTLGLENTIFSFGDTSASPTSPTPLKFGVSGTSTITLAGKNAISTTGELTITGTHSFKGDGTLDFVGQTVNLGNGSSAEFKVTGDSNKVKIGVKAETVNTNELTLTNLTLQAIDSKIVNTKMTLNNSTLEAIDREGNLSELKITKNGNAGTINVANGTTAVLKGSGISLTEQNITLENSGSGETTLLLEAGSGGITIDGGTSGSTIKGSSQDMTKNLFKIHSSTLITKGKVTLENIVLVSDRDVTIVGTEKESSKGLFIAKNLSQKVATLAIGEKVDGGARFHALTLTSQGLGGNEQANVSIASNDGTVDFRASSFTFQNQNINLANNTSGTELRLFAYGNGVIEEKFYTMSGGKPTAQLSGSGVFNFSNTTFTDGSGSKVELYAGSDGVNLLPTNLTLKNVSLDAKIIDDNGGSSLNTLNLSSGSIHISGTSTIQASKFVYSYEENGATKNVDGIGADLFVGDKDNKGNLTLTGKSGTSENFVLGGELALDLRGTNGGASSIDINITNGTTHKLSDNTLGLTFRGGGLTVIGDGTNNKAHIFKAKSFTFQEVKDSAGMVINSPFVKVQNAELTLNGESSMSEIDLVGRVYLEGQTSGDNGVSKLMATNNGQQSGQQVTLKLHDIEAVGNSTIDSNKLEFMDSNIKVSHSGTKGLTLLDKTTNLTNDTIAGTINSITLDSGKLAFQYNSSSDATIKLKADSLITSSGTSSLTLKTIKVGDGDKGLYSLKITDGTFTLTEKTAGTQLGAITLGNEATSISGTGATFSYMNGTSNSYNALTLRGNLTSYGNSSIIADSFTINAKEKDGGNYAISSTGGTLTLKAQTANLLDLTADLTLKEGGLKYVDKDGQNAELKFGNKSTITSSGNSSIEAKNLDLNGANVTASEGILTLKGVNSNTKVGKVVVGNAGVLRLEGSNTKLATLRVNDTISLGASVPYITPDEPLGKGTFGQVVAESVLFESQGTSPLINLSLSQASGANAMSDSLFALREGGITLIDTNSGIKKKTSNAGYSNITLEDVSSNLGKFTSISLQPYLKYGTDKQGKQIVEDLMLNLQVTQTTVAQLEESIKDPSKKEQMQSLLSAGSNALVIETIMNSKDNPLKAGMALYISSGNVGVVANTLEYITGAFIGLNDSLYASHKVAQGLKMIRATNVENRMVRGKNPYFAKLEVAQLVKRAVGVAYASSDDEILLEDEESGVRDGELWASFDGAMSFSETMGNASVYGFSGGYDTLLGEQKNYLLGFYFGYGYGSYSANFATNNSHNVSLGFYSRMSFENNEVDLLLSQSIGLNTAYIDYGATNSYVASMLKQSIDYNFYTTDIEARYGYVFSVGDKENPYYFRPFGGINFAMVVNSEGRGDGEAPIGVDSLITYQLGVSAGVEMRKYFGENYIFLLPMIEKGLLNDGSGTKIGFVGAQSIGYNLPYTVDTGVSVYLGGQGNVGENIAVNGGVGVKVGLESKEVLTNWNVGIRYKF